MLLIRILVLFFGVLPPLAMADTQCPVLGAIVDAGVVNGKPVGRLVLGSCYDDLSTCRLALSLMSVDPMQSDGTVSYFCRRVDLETDEYPTDTYGFLKCVGCQAPEKQ